MTNINSFTASNGNTSLNSYTASNDTKWSNLAGQTGSYVTSAITASSLVTASVNLNTITFTKGDASTFNIIVNTGSAVTTDITALNSFTASQETKDTTLASVTSSLNSATASLFTSASLALVTASAVGNTITFTKGDTSTFAVSVSSTPIDTGSLVTTASFNSYTSSNDQKVNSLISATGSYATTGSNTFVGNQTLTGSLFVSGNINMVNGADIVTHHVKAPGVNGVEIQTNTGGVVALFGAGGSLGTTFYGQINATSISASTINGLGDPLAFSTSVDSRLDGLEALTSSIVPLTSLNAFTASQDTKNSTLATYTASVDSSLSNINTFTQSIIGTNPWTASIDTKFATLGGLTGSYATTGSNVFVGNQTITGSLILSSSAAVELQVIGNLVLTGSAIGNVVSMSVTSNTASMNFNLGNYFELTASVSPIRIEVSNLSGGVTSTLALNGVTSSTINWSSNVLQPSGSAYTASVSGSNDILSFVAFNSGKVNVVSTLKMI